MGISNLDKISLVAPRSEIHHLLRELSDFKLFHVDKPEIWWLDKKTNTVQFRFFYNVDAVKPIPCSSVEACNKIIQPASNFVRVVEAIRQKS